MKTIELTEEDFSNLLVLTNDLHETLPDDYKEIIKKIYEKAEDAPDTEMIQKIYTFYPQLVTFDETAGKPGYFAECVKTICTILPIETRDKPVIYGTTLIRILNDPDAAGAYLGELWKTYSD